ncbi:NirD/YgiW/YdeI family stress tolerance protein [uncultured Turicimonas sp.]|uniref:NirD/YgiW/YdeI family stress tolerance protein n=1 Tax=uncultured Turicimonas sp. TaxID=1918607 RepID=UPI003211A316
MISKTVLAALVAGSFAFGLPAAQAQFTGAGANVTPVEKILSQGKDNQYVAVEGYIVQKVGNKDYIFKDKTGEIRVEIKDRVFANQPVSPTTKVLLEGEVDKDWTGPMEIDVKKLTVVK